MPEEDVDTLDSVENARVVFEQYWLHARHVENHRLWLTNLFVIIFAGLLGCMAFIEQTSSYIPLAGFILSLIGLFSIHATRVPFLRFSRMAETITALELGLGEYRRFFQQEAGSLKETKDKFWSLHRTFIIFYCLAGGGWAALFTHSYISSWGILCVIFIIIAAALYSIYKVTFWKKELKVEEELKKLSDDLKAKSGHPSTNS